MFTHGSIILCGNTSSSEMFTLFSIMALLHEVGDKASTHPA